MKTVMIRNKKRSGHSVPERAWRNPDPAGCLGGVGLTKRWERQKQGRTVWRFLKKEVGSPGHQQAHFQVCALQTQEEGLNRDRCPLSRLPSVILTTSGQPQPNFHGKFQKETIPKCNNFYCYNCSTLLFVATLLLSLNFFPINYFTLNRWSSFFLLHFEAGSC